VRESLQTRINVGDALISRFGLSGDPQDLLTPSGTCAPPTACPMTRGPR